MRLPTLLICLGVLFSLFHPGDAAADSEKAGDVLAVMIPVTAYGASFYRHDQEGQRQQEKSLAATVGITYGLKELINHDGPNGKAHSFPSGHAALAFAGAANLQHRYGWQYGVPALLAATYVGYSRVESDEHHWEDVLAGATIGLINAWYFVTPGEHRLTLTPLSGRGQIGLLLAGSW